MRERTIRWSWMLGPLLLMATGLQAADQKHLHPFETRQLSDKFYAEGCAAADINGDGHKDIVAGPFWFEGPDFEKRHAYYEPQTFDVNGYSDNFLAYTGDINEDGRPDILIVGFPGKPARWYENPGGERVAEHWPKHEALDWVGNESPMFKDITGDGRRELVCQRRKQFGYATPNPSHPTRPWTWHPISEPDSEPGKYQHGLGVGDLNGDGRKDLLFRHGWYEQPESLEGDPVWRKHTYRFSKPGGAQMHVYDVDADGDQDVVTALRAHAYGIAWFEQVETEGGGITFNKHKIIGKDPNNNRFGVAFSQPHAVELVDMDGDGDRDIVTGKRYWAHNGKDPGAEEPAVVYWFRLDRKKDEAEFVPRPIHNDSGVGTQLEVADVTGDGLPDVITANKKGIYLHTHGRRQVGRWEWFWAHQPGMFTMGLTPEQAAEAMRVPEGFNVDLVAGEPDVRQPIAMAFDGKGRLYIAEHYAYPEWTKDGEKDRIIVFEDTTGDGKLNERSVFYDGLNFVSGLEVGHGGVWVGAPPDLLFIPDGDHDAEPDGEPRTKLTGWGHQDTHETLNGFIWGPDGWLYGSHGVFTHSKVGKPSTPKDEREPINGGFWRYHPYKDQFEVFAWGTSNPWGIDFNDRGQAFSPVCVIPHLHHVIQGGRHRRQAGQHFNPYVYESIKTIGDHLHHGGGNIRKPKMSTEQAGGGHAHCGAMIYLGDNWPEKYRNDLYMGNIRGSRINHDTFERRGSGYVGRHRPDLMVSEDPWFRPINVRYGPDGGVYCIDWYDRRACHQQKPDDRSNGRIFKITYGQPEPHNPDLHARSDLELAELQLHPNDWHVRNARRILQRRHHKGGGISDKAVDELWRIYEENPKVPRKLRAVWALHVTVGLDRSQIGRLLDSEHEYVRAWAVQLAGEDKQVAPELRSRFAQLAENDPSPVVRLYLASLLQRLPNEQRWPIAEGLVAHAEDADDHNLPKMIWYGVEPLVEADPPRAMGLWRTARIEKVRRFIVRRATDAGAFEPVVALLADRDNAADRKLILGEALTALKGRPHVGMPERWSQVYERLRGSNSAKVRDQARALAVKFGDERVFPYLRKIVRDSGNKTERRREALAVLVAGRDEELPPLLGGLLDEQAMRRPAIRALAAFEHAKTPKLLLQRYGSFGEKARADAIQTLASRPSYAVQLLDAVAAGDIAKERLSAYTIRKLRLLGSERVASKLRSVVGGLADEAASVPERMSKYRKIVTAGGGIEAAEPSRGRVVYNRTCANCHQLYGEGGDVGPKLTGGNRQQLNYLLINLAAPSAAVGQGYELNIITTSDGRVLTGLVQQETAHALTVRTINETITLPKQRIAHREQTSRSMMPNRVLAPLSEQEVRDLFAYLMTKQQPPLPNEKKRDGE